MPEIRKRPLSPHATIYKIGPAMAVSFIHRITGSGLAVAGTLMLLWFLYALSSGPDAYTTFLNFSKSWLGMVIFIGLTWAFFQHLGSGIRHFVMDIGAGYELRTARLSSLAVFAFAVVATILFWGYIFFLK